MSMQNCKYINYTCILLLLLISLTSSCIVMSIIENMMSVLQGLKEELYFITLSRRKSYFHANFRFNCSHGLYGTPFVSKQILTG